MYIYIYIHRYKHICIYVCVYTYIYTHYSVIVHGVGAGEKSFMALTPDLFPAGDTGVIWGVCRA
jgi:hypothetical protein